MFCTNCGSQVDDGQKFCTTCGAPMTQITSAATTQQFQQGNELDYYLLEETTEAAMLDAVDIAYYRYKKVLIDSIDVMS